MIISQLQRSVKVSQAWLRNAISCLPPGNQCHEFYQLLLLTEGWFSLLRGGLIKAKRSLKMQKTKSCLCEVCNVLKSGTAAQHCLLFRYSLFHSSAPKGGLISCDLGVARSLYLCTSVNLPVPLYTWMYFCNWLHLCTWESPPSCTPPRFHPVRNQPRPNLMHLHLERTYLTTVVVYTRYTRYTRYTQHTWYTCYLSYCWGVHKHQILEIYIRF